MPELRSITGKPDLLPDRVGQVGDVFIFGFSFIPDPPPVVQPRLHRSERGFKDDGILQVKGERMQACSVRERCGYVVI
jgi:hypothetical protein